MIIQSKESRAALILTVLFAVATGVAIYYFSMNNQNEGFLANEKVKSEKVLSEKLALAKEVEKLNQMIQSYKGKNSELDASLTRLQTQLDKQQKSINSGKSAGYTQELASLRALRDQLNGEVNRLYAQLADLNSQNSSLKNALSAMEESNENLANRNYMLTQMMADKYEVGALKKKEKLTVRARKVRELIMEFDIPVEMTDKLSFTITGPDGKKVNSTNSKSITYALNEDYSPGDGTAVVSITGTVVPVENAKRVKLTYKPENKLKSGVYQIGVYSESNYLGSSQIKLQ